MSLPKMLLFLCIRCFPNNMAWLETEKNAGPYFRKSIFYQGHLLALSTHNEDTVGPVCLL